MNGSTAVDMTHTADGPQEKSLALPLVSLSKRDIDERAEFWLNDQLEISDAGTVWVYVKQMEELCETLKGKLSAAAFDSIGQQLGGQNAGKFLGHDVKITYRKDWLYSRAVSDLKAKQKLDMEALQSKEKAEGIATQSDGKGILSVTLRKE
jgi:hypothetical protein